MDQKTLRALRREWDKKLKESGFEDIEDRESPREMLKSWHSTKFFYRFDEDRFLARKDYFELATQFLGTHRFESEIDREVWRLHTEGESLRKIANHLTSQGSPMSKDGALKIIRALLKAMRA